MDPSVPAKGSGRNLARPGNSPFKAGAPGAPSCELVALNGLKLRLRLRPLGVFVCNHAT